VILAGERLRPDLVRTLANLLPDDELAGRLLAALDTDTTIFALSDAQCEILIDALDESPPSSLASLRGVLVQQRDLRARRRETQQRTRRSEQERQRQKGLRGL
jgi:hypothetical protein